jgi:hypothetical protein
VKEKEIKGADAKFKEREGWKKMIVDAEPEAVLVHSPPHRVGGSKIFQMPP